MKKIYISNYDDIKNPNYGGGGARAVHEIAKNLREKYRVTVISWNHSGIGEEIIDNVKYHRYGSKHIYSKIGMMLFQAITCFLAAVKRYDYWIEGSTPPTTFSFLPLFANGKVISWVHMFAGDDMVRKYKIPFTVPEKYLSRLYRNIIVQSEWSKNKLINDYENKNARIDIIPNGISKSAIKLNQNTNNSFVFVGRFEINQKGIDLLLESFKKIPKAKLILAGWGSKEEVAYVKKQIKNLSLEKRVKLTGWVDHKTRDKLLSKCLGFVLPSRYDTYPLVVLEAFQFGKPVIFFDIPQLSWIPQNASIKVKSFDTEKYATALNKLYKNEKLRQRLGKNAQKFVNNKDWGGVSKKIEGFINSI